MASLLRFLTPGSLSSNSYCILLADPSAHSIAFEQIDTSSVVLLGALELILSINCFQYLDNSQNLFVNF